MNQDYCYLYSKGYTYYLFLDATRSQNRSRPQSADFSSLLPDLSDTIITDFRDMRSSNKHTNKSTEKLVEASEAGETRSLSESDGFDFSNFSAMSAENENDRPSTAQRCTSEDLLFNPGKEWQLSFLDTL